MTNEELDCARSDEAYRIWLETKGREVVGIVAARLAREGWTPPVAVDPDIAEAEAIWFEGKSSFDLVLEGIKRGRELERAVMGNPIPEQNQEVTPSVDPEVGSIWKHYNGNVYEVIAIANTLDTEKYPKAVIHKTRANGKVWTRRADDWHRSYTQQTKTSETPVDPDFMAATKMADDYEDINDCPISTSALLGAIKRGRALAAAETKPGVVWVKHDGSNHGGDLFGEYVWVKHTNGTIKITEEEFADWPNVTHYAVITPPAEDVA